MNKCNDCPHKKDCKRFDFDYAPIEFLEWHCKYFQKEIIIAGYREHKNFRSYCKAIASKQNKKE